MVTRKSFFAASLDVLAFIHDGTTTRAELSRVTIIPSDVLANVLNSLMKTSLLEETNSKLILTPKGLNVVKYYKENSDSTNTSPMIRIKPQ
jgi:predicted transcriptional regulator